MPGLDSGAMPMGLNDLEEEAVFLKAITEMVDSMVNCGMLTLHGRDPDVSVLFKTSMHQRFFNILLVDCLSRTDKKAPVKQSSYLGALRAISAHPRFDVCNSVAALRDATYAFVQWLEQEVSVDVWLPSINTQTSLQISRLTFLKMCGDISKHNVLRSVGVAEELQQTLAASGVSVGLEDAMLVLGDFYERFHTDILNYHSSTISEFLNNIRWGIYEYLQPELQRSIVWEEGNPHKYHYTFPIGVENDFARRCYWDLMNEVRHPPYVRRFQVTKWLKLRY
jgi:hypothetical protein